MKAYYNDHDKKVCAWLEQLIKNGDITKGDVDDRSITEITADDIAGYDRVHLFAGIGTWDYALNQAGWGDRPVLTASLPCQPFSAAGKGLGKEDERHLLLQAVDLIIKSGIDTIFGEQVERAIAHGWLDDLQAVMEAKNYAVGHVVLGAHSVNMPHIRQRLYWVADYFGNGSQGRIYRGSDKEREIISGSSGCGGSVGGVGYSEISTFRTYNRESGESAEQQEQAGGSGIFVGMANANSKQNHASDEGGLYAKSGGGCDGSGIEWIWCRDNKYRPTKRGVSPLVRAVESSSIKMVDGSAGKLVHSSNTGAQIEANNTQEARTMRLKGYGNAIQAKTAEAFIRAFMSI